ERGGINALRECGNGIPGRLVFSCRKPAAAGRKRDLRMGDAGDEIRSWYAEVVAKNYRLFYTIAYGVLHDAHAADDATQEAMLRAFEKIAALTEPAGVVPWLAQITRNVSLDIRKKGGKRKVR